MDTTIIKQLDLNLTPQEFDQVIKRLCFFSPSGSGTYIRDLHDFVTLQVLSMMPSGQHSTHEIYEKLREVLGKRFEYEEILNAIKRLSHSGQIRATTQRFDDPDNKFDILIDKRNELRDMAKQEENLES